MSICCMYVYFVCIFTTIFYLFLLCLTFVAVVILIFILLSNQCLCTLAFYFVSQEMYYCLLKKSLTLWKFNIIHVMLDNTYCTCFQHVKRILQIFNLFRTTSLNVSLIASASLALAQCCLAQTYLHNCQ